MLKFILLLIIIYYLLRLLIRYVLPILLKHFIQRKFSEFGNNMHHDQYQTNHEETIFKSPDKSKKHISKNTGEYIDFEEIKD